MNIRKNQKKQSYHWLICICCSLVFLCSCGLTTSGFSVFLPYIRAEIGISNSAVGSIVATRQIVAVLALLVCPKILKKLGPKRCIIIALLSLGLAFFVYSCAREYALFIVGGVLAGIGYSMGGMVTVSCLTSNWFISKKALATSICLAGSGLAPVIFSPIVTVVIEKYSLKLGFLLISVFSLIVCAISLIVFTDTPDEKGLLPYSDEVDGQAKEKTYGSGLSDKTFIVACIGFFFMGTGANTASTYIASIYRSIDFDPYTVSLISSAYGFSTFLGKILFGMYADAKGNKKAYGLFQAIAVFGAGLALIALRGILPLAFAAEIIEGFGIVTATSGLSMAALEFSNKDNYVKRLSALQLANTVGGIIASLSGGKLADFFQSYIPVAIVETVYLVVSGILVLSAYGLLKNTEMTEK